MVRSADPKKRYKPLHVMLMCHFLHHKKRPYAMSMIYQSLVENDAKHVWRPFTQALTAPKPIAIRSASGANLVTEDGHVLLDLISSWWVNLHGHSHPVIADAIAQQAHTLEHVIFAGFTHEPAVRLAAHVSAITPASLTRVFFSDNGSTAVEVALKMAFQYMANIGQPQRTRFIAFEGGYHGDTVGAMSVGASSGFFRAWSDMLFPVDVMPVATCDSTLSSSDLLNAEKSALAHLESHLEQWGNMTAAAIIEPLIQGAGGMRMHRPEFLQAVVERLRHHGILVIFDEVMTGFGRTGQVFSCQTAHGSRRILSASPKESPADSCRLPSPSPRKIFTRPFSTLHLTGRFYTAILLRRTRWGVLLLLPPSSCSSDPSVQTLGIALNNTTVRY